jgi:hypothetical protein
MLDFNEPEQSDYPHETSAERDYDKGKTSSYGYAENDELTANELIKKL